MSEIGHFTVGPAKSAALDAFQNLFGLPLEFWLYEGEAKQPIVTAEALDSCIVELFRASLPGAAPRLSQPSLQEMAPGTLSIGLPLKWIDSRWDSDAVIWALVQTSLETLAAALLRVAALQKEAESLAAELQQGVDPHLEQISRDFEELTWLQELNDRLVESTVDDSLETVAQRILPELKPLITAESVALIHRPRCESAEADSTETPTIISWCGPQLLTDSGCRELAAWLDRRSEPNRPTIVNHLGALDIGAQFPGIESCLQVALVRQGIEYGWLLALNRAPEFARYPRFEQSILTHAGHFEFGTEEAGLMVSAASTLASHARNSQLFREKENLLIGIIKAMINALDARDPYTCGHSDRVAVSAKQIGQRLGLDPQQCDLLYMSGLLHDIGKIGIPDEVLLKPGKLTQEEFEIIAQHPSIGHAILSHLPQLKSVLPGVLYHHEHLNGRGYPHGLKGDDIPLFGRILAVADAFDAMTTCRPYRTAMPLEKAQAILQDGSGSQWDPAIVEAFLECLPSILQSRTQEPDRLQAIFETAAAAGQASLGERAATSRRTPARMTG